VEETPLDSNPTCSANDLRDRRPRLPIGDFRRQLRAIGGIGSDPSDPKSLYLDRSRLASLAERFGGRLRDVLAAHPTLGFLVHPPNHEAQ
jgi:hypothetical protein